MSFAGTKYWELWADDCGASDAANVPAGKKYSAPQWKDVDGNGIPTNTSKGEHNYAIAYTRNAKPQIGAEFKILGASNFGTIEIRATGPDGIKIPETAATVSGDVVTLPSTTQTVTALVNTIKFYNAMDDAKAFKLDWEVKLGASNWSKIGTTNHTVYVTLNDPQNSSADRQLTLFDTACREATGLTAESEAVDKIYCAFTRVLNGVPAVQRINPKTFKPTGDPMTYWGTSNPAPQPQCWSTAGLLLIGDGRCGAWANFFYDALRVNGITSTVETVNPPENNVPGTSPNPPSLYTAAQTKLQSDVNAYLPSGSYQVTPIFYVKNWNLLSYATAPFSPVRNSGVPGQGNPNPRSDFDNHAIVEYSGKYYDPSYGSPVSSSRVNWEDASLDGYGAYIVDAGSALIQFKWIWEQDPKGTQETIFQP